MADQSPAARPKYKRSARNYLLDKHFQLKYTGFLVGIAIILSSVLGALLWKASDEVLMQTRGTVDQGKEAVQQGQRTVDQGQATVDQGKETIDRGKSVIKLSNDLNKLVTSTIENCYKDDEGLLTSFKNSTAEDDKKLLAEQSKLEADNTRLESDTQRLREDKVRLEERANGLELELKKAEKRQLQIRIGLAGVLVTLVLGIGIAGIMFTHKIAGPIFKMKRLFRQVGEGKLLVREKLRKGDELVHFFEAFEKMVGDLRDKKTDEIAAVDAILAQLENGEKTDKTVARLRELRAEMQHQVEA